MSSTVPAESRRAVVEASARAAVKSRATLTLPPKVSQRIDLATKDWNLWGRLFTSHRDPVQEVDLHD